MSFDDIPVKWRDLFSVKNKQNITYPSSVNFIFSMLKVKIGHKNNKPKETFTTIFT